MLIREYLKSLICCRKSNSRSRLPRPYDLSEQLELRTLLTGNVQISLNGANAQFTGDTAANQVEVVVDNGSVVVRGLNGTTINQGTTDFTLATGVTALQGSLTGSLGGGDDVVTIGVGITLTGNVSLSGGDGADTLRVLGGTLHGNLTLNGDNGVTSIVVDGATISGNLAISGAESTLASISNSNVHGRLDVSTGDSADSVVVQSTTVNGVTAIHTGRGDDNVVLQNSTLHGRLWVETGAGNDVVYVNSSNVGKSARIALRRGNDTVQVLGGSNFDGRLVVAGGAGHDAANIDSDTSARHVAKHSQKAKYFDASLISSRITDSTTGAIARANALLAAAVPTLTLSVSPATVSENAGTAASTLTVTRTGPTTAAQIVTLTSSNTSKATVPATVTIPVGSTSVTAPIAAIDNTVADGSATVTITAAATGFANVTTTLTVTDNEVAALTVTANQTTVSEGAGATAVTYTVVRNTADITQPLTVTLLSGTPTRLTVPATVIIPANAASVTFGGAAIENTIVDGTASVIVTTSATGFTSGTATVAVTDNENAVLSVTSAAATVSEASGTLAGTVTTSFVSSVPILVSLSYETSNILTGPASVTIPAGAASVPVTFTIVNGSVQDQNLVARIEATAPGAATGVAQVTVTDADSMALTAIATADDSVQSNGTIITRNSVTQVTGITTAGASITVDSDGNGVFDNGTATAGVDGSYTVNVTLLHTATNHGENRLVLKASSGANSADTAVRAHLAIGTVVHFATNQGAYDVELLDTEAPLTVANFLSYVESGAYQNMFAHRTNSGSAKFVQGGGFKVSNGQISSVITTIPVQNEFNAANSNVSGTLSMALLGGGQFNSGTSQWFVNTSNNGAGFDPGKYTVFGRVIGDGVTVATQISNLPNVHPQLNTLYNSTALSEAPLSAFNPANTPITGTVAITLNSAVITGTNTLFTTELAVGQSIVIGSGRAYIVASIQSNTSLTLTTTGPAAAASLAVTKDVVPNDADFVIFSNIGKILDTI